MSAQDRSRSVGGVGDKRRSDALLIPPQPPLDDFSGTVSRDEAMEWAIEVLQAALGPLTEEML